LFACVFPCCFVGDKTIYETIETLDESLTTEFDQLDFL
jgi:hypothetical protein